MNLIERLGAYVRKEEHSISNEDLRRVYEWMLKAQDTLTSIAGEEVVTFDADEAITDLLSDEALE